MTRNDRVVLVALVAWTAFVWIQRLVNLAGEDADRTAAATSLVLALTLLGLAAASAMVLVVSWRTGWAVPSRVARGVLCAFAGWTIAVWVVRGTQIALDWRSTGFVVVHLVLAAVSVALASRVWRIGTTLGPPWDSR